MPALAFGYVGIAKEAAFGSGVTPTTFIPVTSAEMNTDPQNFYPEEIRGSRSRSRVVPMGRKNEGSIEATAEANGLGHFLLGAIGSVATTTTTAGVFQHVFTPSNILPSYSIERYDTTMVQRGTGAKLGSLTLSLEAGGDGVLTAEADYVIQAVEDQVSAATPNYADRMPFTYTGVTVTKGGTSNSNIKSFELTIENNLKDDQYVLRQSRDVAEISEGQREVSGSIEMLFRNKAEYQAFFTGATDSLKLEFSGAVISGSDSDKLTIELPRIAYDSFEVPMGGPDDDVIASLDFTALNDPAISAEIKVTLQNSVTTY